jgi:hypothetical protein
MVMKCGKAAGWSGEGMADSISASVSFSADPIFLDQPASAGDNLRLGLWPKSGIPSRFAKNST